MFEGDSSPLPRTTKPRLDRGFFIAYFLGFLLKQSIIYMINAA